MEILGGIGLFVVFGYLILSMYSSYREGKSANWSVLALATLALVLVFSPRLTMMELFGLKATLHGAKDDAKVIKALRAQIEQTASKMDAIRQEATRRLDSIERVQHQGDEALEKLTAVSNFSLVLSRAKSDDRNALRSLLRIGQDPSDPFSKFATESLAAIKDDINRTNAMVPSLVWREGHSLKEVSYDNLSTLRLNTSRNLRLDLLAQVWHCECYTTLQKLDFLAWVIQTTDSIYELQRACNLFNDEAGLKITFLSSDGFLAWWHDNRNKYVQDSVSAKNSIH